MFRTALATFALAAALTGCTPCARIANAEAGADDKGKACSSSSGKWTDAQISTCNDNLKNCSAEDQKWMDTYADCLNKLPTCADGQGFSWGLQRLGCVESLTKISYACAKGMK